MYRKHLKNNKITRTQKDISFLQRDCQPLSQGLLWISIIQRRTLNFSVNRMYSIVTLNIYTQVFNVIQFIASKEQIMTKKIFAFIGKHYLSIADFYPKVLVFQINIMAIGGRNALQIYFITSSANEEFFETITKIMIEFMKT